MRFLNKDLLNLKFNRNKSYWIEKTGPKSKMKNQFSMNFLKEFFEFLMVRKNTGFYQ